VLILSNYSPRSLTSGFALNITGGVTLDVEAQYAFWSEAPPPLLVTTVDLSGEGLEALGIENGLDAPAPGQNRVNPPGFVDTMNWRVGVEWKTLKDMLAVRAGYQLRPTPIPDQTTGTNFADNTAHVVSTGFGLTFRWPQIFKGPVTVEGAYQAQILQPRRTEKVSPNDPVGSWTSHGAVHSIALGWVYEF
jgi:long-subunit fatty acid transport protein